MALVHKRQDVKRGGGGTLLCSFVGVKGLLYCHSVIPSYELFTPTLHIPEHLPHVLQSSLCMGVS